MTVTKDLKCYILKHKSGQYVSGCYSPINVYLTEEPLMAEQFPSRESAEQTIANAKISIAAPSDGVSKAL